MRVLFVHGACVVDGAWWWHRMTAPLAGLGLATEAVELPSCGPSGDDEPLGDLDADVAAVRRAAGGSTQPTVLVGHSYGGMVITGAAAGLENVRHLVYVASMLPDEGESLAALADPDGTNWLEPEDESARTVRLRTDLSEDDFRAHFLDDCDEPAAAGAPARVGRQSAAVFGQPSRDAGWRRVASTAVVCARDRATRPEQRRRWAARAGTVVELDSGHHPFLSRPGELAEIIARLQPRTSTVS
ncbi:MAG: alpha/beta hydrolase, partial [Pseudonocardia sp.]|nr:alpha/beta hydrolase [Pseudonocardia sp.]